MSGSSSRVERLLVVVPYILHHQGVGIDELLSLFGGTKKSLINDLTTLMMTGMPPFTPGDLVDVEFDEEGGVWISMADHFARPLRLTRTEALALYLRGMEALGAQGLPEATALSRALEKLRAALGDELGSVVERTVAVPGGSTDVGPLTSLQQAASSHRRVELTYYTHSRDEMTSRVIDPEHVYWAAGAWYVIAFDSLAEAERTFRVDRIASATILDESFAPRGLVGPGRSVVPIDGHIIVRLRIQPPARWICEYFDARVIEEHSDGSATVEIMTTHEAWVVKLLLRLGRDAAILEPPGLLEAVRAEAARTLARYA